MKSIFSAIAEFAVGTPSSDIPSSARHIMSRSLLDESVQYTGTKDWTGSQISVAG